MTLSPKDKAKELVHSYLTASFGTIEEYVPVPYVFAKQCAIITCEEILKLDFIDSVFLSFSDLTLKEYYQQVKTEIENL